MIKGEINRTGFVIGIQVELIMLEKRGKVYKKMGVIQIIQIIVLLNLIQSPQSFVLDPICQSCISVDSSLFSTYYNQSLKTNFTLFQLPGFSMSTIIVDLQHLEQFPQHNNETIFQLIFEITDISSQSKTIQQVNDTIIGTNVYELETTAEQTLMIFFIVQNEYKQFEYLLRDSISFNLSYSNNRIPSQDSSFVFVVSSQDEISLPSNKPDLNNNNNFYLENERNTYSFVTTNASSDTTTYWGTQSQFAVSYFPYFTNCNDEGNLMHIMQMLQNQTDCSLVPINETQSINEFSFGSSAKADKCLIKRKCTIQGDVQKNEYPDWMTLTQGLNLFAISQQKVNWRDFSYDMDIQDQDLVQCKINSSMGTNSSSTYPLNVKLSIGYYQFSQTGKKIISCLVEYDLYVESSSNFTYRLQIEAYPLNHTYILLNFGFKWYVYMIVFLIIGIIGNIENLLLWIYHYFVTDQKKEIKIMMYFKIIKEIIKGTIMALFLELIILIVVCVIMNGKIFTTTFYTYSATGSTKPHVLFDYILQTPIKNYDSDDMQKLRSGRMGLGFVTIGVMILILYSKHFVGKQKAKEEYKDFQILGRIFKPIDWNRGKFLFGTFIYILIQYFFIYFAYSSLYSANIWTFIVVVKVVQIIMEEITKSIYDDVLPGLPLKIVTDITAFMNTISAADLYDFLFGSLIDVAVTMIEKIYIFQIQNAVVEKIIEKGEEFNRFYVNLMNEEDGEEEGKDKLLASEDCMMGEMDENEDQEVFISREAQEVEFFQEQVKEISIFTIPDEEALLIAECRESQSEKRLKRRYFQSLHREGKYQHQLLSTNGKQSRYQKHRNGLQERQVDQQKREEQLEKESAIFQLLLDHMAMIYTFILQPFVVFIFWLTYDQSQVFSKYGIVYNTVILYLLSSLVIGALTVINIIIIFHILQNYMGYSFQQQVADILERFNLRESFWITEQHWLNHNLKEDMLGADHYCLSSQLFFILTVYVGGMEFVILGLAIIFQTNYNFFDDVATIPIIIFWISFLFIFIQIVIKIATIINIWDYQKYNTKTQTQQNFYGIMDQKQLMIHMQQNSDFKTENIIFAPLEEIPNFNKLFKQKTLNQDEKEQRKSYFEEQSENAKSFQKNQKKRFHHTNIRISNSEEKNQIILAQKRLEIICKKLQPLFLKESFKLQYARKNQQFIKENIEKILPLVDYLPDLSEYRGMLAPTANNQSRIGSSIVQKHTAQLKHQQASSPNKNMDPVVAEMILEWLRVTEKERQKRIINGIELEGQNKKCSFCLETWALYYGHDGICLNCSMRLSKKKNQKETLSQKLIMNLSKESLLSQNQSNLRRGKKKKSSKKKNRLNVITEEEDLQDENTVSQDDESDEEIMKSNKKEHHE